MYFLIWSYVVLLENAVFFLSITENLPYSLKIKRVSTRKPNNTKIPKYSN